MNVWQQFLQEIFGNQETIHAFQKAISAAIMHDRGAQLCPEQPAGIPL